MGSALVRIMLEVADLAGQTDRPRRQDTLAQSNLRVQELAAGITAQGWLTQETDQDGAS